MKVSDVRQLINVTLRDLGFNDPQPVGERLVIQDHFYIGCRFDFEGASVTWMQETGQVRFFDDSGKLLKVIRLNGGNGVIERAA